MDIAKPFMIFQFEGMRIVLQSYQGFNSNEVTIIVVAMEIIVIVRVVVIMPKILILL